MQDDLSDALCVEESSQKKYIKAYKNTATESNVALFTFLKFLINIENDQHLLYLP